MTMTCTFPAFSVLHFCSQQTFSHVTWKRAKVNLDLIDVDLVRGMFLRATHVLCVLVVFVVLSWATNVACRYVGTSFQFIVTVHYVHICMYDCYMYLCMYACVYVYMCVCMYDCMYICMYVYVCMYVCIYVCMYVCMCVGLYLCMYVYVCMYVCVCM